MANINLSSTDPGQTDGAATIDATLANNRMDLPGWVKSVDAYIDDAAGGSFSRKGTATGLPLPGQTYVRVWERIEGRARQSTSIWFASASGSQTLYYLLG